MKGTILAALLLGGLVQNAAILVAQTSTSRTTPSKKKNARKKSKPRYKSAPPVDPTDGDNVDGDDLEIRRAAVDAIGTMNGAVVVADPNSGRILTMVNQKLALKSGFIPCSTIKLVTSIAALNEHLITRDTFIPISRRVRYNLTTAIAHSNNQYFSILGNRLGFERVTHYAQLLGLGEKAGLDIPGEQPGSVAAEPPKWGGVGLMTSFGEGFQMTPLELAGLLSAIANGGTLYYLQYPHSQEEMDSFAPRVKRDLNISNVLPEVREGMLAAVLYGTGRLSYDAGGDETPLGKTGTCDDHSGTPSRIGWFVSYADETHPKIALAVLLRGNTRRVKGPTAAQVAGHIYRRLRQENYFGDAPKGTPIPANSTGK